MSELKPCPFCGSTRQELTYSLSINTERTYYGNGIICANCRVCVPEYEWNTRPIEDKMQAEIERLKSERRWIPVDMDSWTYCPYPCEVRFTINGKPTHYRPITPEDE